MSVPCPNYELSYPINSVSYNGQFVTKLEDEAFVPTCKVLKSLGIHELMITGYVTVEEADFDMMEETKRLGGLLESMGMRPAQHHGLSAMFAQPETGQDAVIEKLIRSVQYTANLNSPVLVIHPAHIDEHYQTLEEYDKIFYDLIERIGRREVMRLMASNLDAAGEVAGKLGVRIAVENVHTFDTDITLMRDLLAESHSPYVGFCMDSGHAHYKSPTRLPDWMEFFKDRLFTTHFHDNRGHADEHMPPGFGTIPWIDVIQKLWTIGYSNTVNFESCGWSVPDMKEGYESAIRFWRCCESHARTNMKRS